MSTSSQQILIEKVRAGLDESGLGKGRYALLLGITRQELDKILKGGANVKLETLDKIASGLGVEPWELIRP